MKKLIILSAALALLTSCIKKENPLSNFHLRSNNSEWKIDINRMYSDNILTKKYDVNTEIYRYLFKMGDDSIYSDVHFNPDRYYFGELRSVKFNLLKDSTFNLGENSFTSRSKYPRNKSEIDKLYKCFENFYGTPDSLSNNFKGLNSRINYMSELRGPNSDPTNFIIAYYELKPNINSLYWENENEEIYFYRSPDEFKLNKDIKGETTYKEAYILYRVKDYREKLESIVDSIKRVLTPEDIVHISFYKPVWETDNYTEIIKINIDEVFIKAIEETREVNGIKLDVVFKNQFNDELFVLKDTELYLEIPIAFRPEFRREIKYTIQHNYGRFNEFYHQLERLRRMDKKNIQVETRVKAITFENGDVLK
jgi:hypothetical protein